MFPKTPHLARPPEAEIRAPPLNQHLAHQHAPRIPHIDAVAAPRVHVPVDIALDAIGRPGVRVREDPSVGQIRLIVGPVDAERINGRRARGVAGPVAMYQVRISHIQRFLIRSERDAIGTTEPVRDDADIARGGVEAVDVLGELRFRPKPLLVAVDGVGEPNRAVGMHDDVVGGVEGAAVVVVQKRGGLVRALRLHVDEPAGFPETPLRAQDQAVAEVRPAVGHVVALRAADFIAREICGAEEFDFGYDDGFVVGGDGVGGSVGDLVGGDEEGVRGRVEDASFVEVGRAWVRDEEGKGGRGAEAGEEGVVVNEEGARRLGGVGGEECGRFPELPFS